MIPGVNGEPPTWRLAWKAIGGKAASEPASEPEPEPISAGFSLGWELAMGFLDNAIEVKALRAALAAPRSVTQVATILLSGSSTATSYGVGVAIPIYILRQG